MGHTLTMRIVAAVASAAIAVIVALWWRRAWAQYRADEQAMAAAMHIREDEDTDYCT